AGSFLLAMIRYLPATAMTSLTPLRWAPPMVRIVLAMVLAWLTVQAQPLQATLPQGGAFGWVVAAVGELMLGLAFGLAVMLPQAALHMGGWLIDIQAGASAAVLFNPAAQGETQSLLGTLLMLVGTVLFFTLDLHLDLY
uniref:flagellar biosynthetic protein FliR n=2 Tax=Bacteria TaxID=2 RepID=UPI0022EC09CA